MRLALVERLGQVVHESTDGWNNAGTGHAGNCELNYTPQNAKGEVEIARALTINANFEVSLQLWSADRFRRLAAPENFIHPTPHISFVWGKDNVAFLRERHAKLSAHPLFAGMEYSEDHATLAQWMPLVMAGRSASEQWRPRVLYGSDVDFGALTQSRVFVTTKAQLELHLNNEVQNLASWPRHLAGRNQELIKTAKANALKRALSF